MPALVRAILRGAALEESIVFSNVVQAAGAAVVVASSNTAGFLGLVLVIAALAPGGQGHSLSTLAHDHEGKDGDDEE